MVFYGFDKSVLSVWNGLKQTLTFKGASTCMCLNGSDTPLIKGRTVVDFHSGGCVA